MINETNQAKAKSLIKRALSCAADEERYFRRRSASPNLTKLGCVPEKLDEIINDQRPWFCHGLALRMATYSEGSDYLFKRWEELLDGANKAECWDKEYAHWASPADHWAIRWDRFYQFLWLLQCVEYFKEGGCQLSFTTSKKKAKPDLRVVQADGSELFVECYYFTKWWPGEHFLEDLLCILGNDLSIKLASHSRDPKPAIRRRCEIQPGRGDETPMAQPLIM